MNESNPTDMHEHTGAVYVDGGPGMPTTIMAISVALFYATTAMNVR